MVAADRLRGLRAVSATARSRQYSNMVWIETSTEHQRSFKRDWMDEPIEWTDTRRANVNQDVAARLVDERDDISYVNDDDDAGDDDEAAGEPSEPPTNAPAEPTSADDGD